MTQESALSNQNLRGIETVLQFDDNTYQYIYHFFIDLVTVDTLITSPILPLQFSIPPNSGQQASGIQANYTPTGTNQIGLSNTPGDVRTYYLGSCALPVGTSLMPGATVSISNFPVVGSAETTTIHGDPNSRRPPIIRLNSALNMPQEFDQPSIAIGVQTEITGPSETPGARFTHIHPDYFVIVVLQAPAGQESTSPVFSKDLGQHLTVNCNLPGYSTNPNLHLLASGVYDATLDYSTGQKLDVKGPKLPSEVVNTSSGQNTVIWWAQF